MQYATQTWPNPNTVIRPVPMKGSHHRHFPIHLERTKLTSRLINRLVINFPVLMVSEGTVASKPLTYSVNGSIMWRGHQKLKRLSGKFWLSPGLFKSAPHRRSFYLNPRIAIDNLWAHYVYGNKGRREGPVRS